MLDRNDMSFRNVIAPLIIMSGDDVIPLPVVDIIK
jgi:hypothetical protein